MKVKRMSTVVLVVFFFLAFALTAIGEGTKGPGKFVKDFEKCGKFFTQMKGMTQGKSPHGKVQIWYSNDLKDLVGQAAFKAPVGAVSIKPFDNDGKDGVDGYAVMVKKEAGYDADNGDWFYEMRKPDGTVMEKSGMPMQGKLKMCIGCHAAASAKDYLAGTAMK